MGLRKSYSELRVPSFIQVGPAGASISSAQPNAEIVHLETWKTRVSQARANLPSTFSRGYVSSGKDTVAGLDMRESSGTDEGTRVVGPGWIDIAAEVAKYPETWAEASLELIHYGNLEGGWFGEGSRGTAPNAFLQASGVMLALAHAVPAGPAPLVGLDDDGFIVLSWTSDALVGSMSIFGDGTYAYFLQGSQGVARSGSASTILDPTEDLVRVLQG